jgi:hypothetical protein
MKDPGYQALKTERELARLSLEMREFKDERLEFKNEMRDFKEDVQRDRKEMNRKWGKLATKKDYLFMDAFLKPWSSADRKKAVIEELEEEGIENMEELKCSGSNPSI